MADFPEKEMKPLFEAYGAACFEGQHLERTLQLLLLLIHEQEKREGKPAETDYGIDSEEMNRTLGELFSQAREKEYFTGAEQKMLHRAIKERNFLIHSYWDKRVQQLTTTEGREWVVSNLDELREVIRSGTSIVDSLIDRYLQQYGISIEFFMAQAAKAWEAEGDSSLDTES